MNSGVLRQRASLARAGRTGYDHNAGRSHGGGGIRRPTTRGVHLPCAARAWNLGITHHLLSPSRRCDGGDIHRRVVIAAELAYESATPSRWPMLAWTSSTSAAGLGSGTGFVALSLPPVPAWSPIHATGLPWTALAATSGLWSVFLGGNDTARRQSDHSRAVQRSCRGRSPRCPDSSQVGEVDLQPLPSASWSSRSSSALPDAAHAVSSHQFAFGWRCRLGGPVGLRPDVGSLGVLTLPRLPLAFALVFPSRRATASFASSAWRAAKRSTGRQTAAARRVQVRPGTPCRRRGRGIGARRWRAPRPATRPSCRYESDFPGQ